MSRTQDEYVCEVLQLEPLLRAYLHRFAPQPSDLDDLLQETYSRLFSVTAERRAVVENVQAFAITVARNIATDWIRHRRVVPIDQVEDMSELPIADRAADLETMVHSHQQLLHISHAIAGLPERCRQVFTLRRVYGFSQKEIARRLGLTEGTVEQHLIKGMRRCAESMAKYEYDEATHVRKETGWFGRWRRRTRAKGRQG